MRSCRSVRSILHRASADLDDGDRLLLEQHLQGCERCAHDRANLLRLRGAVHELPAAPAAERDHARLVAQVLLAGPAGHEGPERRRVRWGLVAVASAALVATAAAATAIGVAIVAGRSDAPPTPATSEPAPVRAPQAPPRTTVAVPEDVMAPEVVPPSPERAPGVDRAPVRPDAASLLGNARAAVAAGRFAHAERFAARALDAKPSRAQAAQAHAIEAECAQGLGRIDDAVARYRAVADRYSDLAVGETSLFSAARLEAKRARTSAARELLERYLDRYSSGRYANDARRLLADLGDL